MLSLEFQEEHQWDLSLAWESHSQTQFKDAVRTPANADGGSTETKLLTQVAPFTMGLKVYFEISKKNSDNSIFSFIFRCVLRDKSSRVSPDYYFLTEITESAFILWYRSIEH
ncbi:hypothetical protein NPIL_430101 [Nephila pilipes]|uniref:Uncharacterized protein n=1 Tax=Nephila pilipes TaxID=299642 RepID=A0A8X6TPV3_NEPPI|nr:hypothetical protein NPIL_430101 [Nephila pilipes]